MKKLITILLLTLSLTACQDEVFTQDINPLSLKEAKEIALAHGFINEKEADFITEEFVDAEDYYFFIIKKDDENHVYKIDSNNGKILLSSDKETDSSLVHHQKEVEKDKVTDKEVVKKDDKQSETHHSEPKDDAKTKIESKPVIKAPVKKDTASKAPAKKETSTKTPVKESTKETTLKNISQDQAIDLALNNAGFSKSQIRKLEVKEKVSKNRKVYEVEFYHGDYEYEYKYAIADGTLIEKKIEFEGTLSGSNPTTIAQAKEKALLRVSGANDNHIRIKEDTEDGRIVYEGKIIYGSYEYEFEIDAQTGIFQEWEQEILY